MLNWEENDKATVIFFKLLPQSFPAGTEESHKISRSGKSASGPRLESGNSRIPSRNNLSMGMFNCFSNKDMGAVRLGSFHEVRKAKQILVQNTVSSCALPCR